MSDKRPVRKRPRDVNELAQTLVDIATSVVEDRERVPQEQGNGPTAMELAVKGGDRGRRATNARWGRTSMSRQRS